DIAVEILGEQHVEASGVLYQVHASGVDNRLRVLDLRVACGNLTRAAEEKAVAHLHDVCLVDRRDFPPPVAHRVLQGELRDAEGSPLRDDLQAFHHPRYDLVLDGRVEVFRILPHHHQVDV